MKRTIRQDHYADVLERINARLPPEQRLDANETAILTRQLVDIDARAYDQLYPELKGTMLFPVKSDIDPGAETYLYEVRDHSGKAKRVTNWATDFPSVDTQSGEVEAPLKSYGDCFVYTLQDARRSLMARRSIEDSRALAARAVLARQLDDTIATGDSEVGITGALNNASVPTFSPVTGVWSNSGTDGAEIAQDLMAILSDIRVDSRGSESGDTILLPPSLEEIATRKLIPNTDVTAMDFFKKNRPGITIETWERLETAGSGGVPRIMAYSRREEKVCALVPVEFETFPPQQEGLAWKVLCHMRSGGVIFRYPGSARYMDGCA